MQNEIENAEGIQLFRDLTVEKSSSEKKRRKREKIKRSLLVLQK